MEIQQAIFFNERWTPITKNSVPEIVEGRYLVSSRGRVIIAHNQREMTLVKTENDYYRVSLLHDNGDRRYHLIHRIIMIEFNPVIGYQDLQVNHIDGNKANNCIWNLEWVTGSQNIIHAYRNGLKNQYHGEDCSWSTINNAQAEQIAQMICSQQYTQQEIADIIGCTKSVVADIATGSNWKGLYNKYDLEKYKKKFVLRLSNEDLHKLCKYFEDHRYIEYRYKSDLYRAALMELFGIEMTQSMSATLSRLHGRVTRRDISDQYNF